MRYAHASCTYIDTHTHTHMYSFTHTHTHAYIHVFIHTQIGTKKAGSAPNLRGSNPRTRSARYALRRPRFGPAHASSSTN